MSDTPETPKATMNKATTLLFYIASDSHTLRSIMGIELCDEVIPDTNRRKLKYLNIQRHWLVREYADGHTYRFDPDNFFKITKACSDGEAHMILWLLNVWNPHYAKSKRRNFDLFQALNTLDSGNRQCIADWLQNPIWP